MTDTGDATPENRSAPSVDVDAVPVGFTVVAGNPTRAELAAVTAVITAMIEEFEDDAARHTPTRQSAWQRSQTGLRTALTPGYGQWRGFAG